MKISNSLIAAAVVALLPLSAMAGDPEMNPAPMGAKKASAQFNTLDTDRDGRLSRTEAASDAKIVFTKADRNGDGFIDGNEFTHRDATSDAMPSDAMPNSSDTDTPRP